MQLADRALGAESGTWDDLRAEALSRAEHRISSLWDAS